MWNSSICAMCDWRWGIVERKEGEKGTHSKEKKTIAKMDEQEIWMHYVSTHITIHIYYTWINLAKSCWMKYKAMRQTIEWRRSLLPLTLLFGIEIDINEVRRLNENIHSLIHIRKRHQQQQWKQQHSIQFMLFPPLSPAQSSISLLSLATTI